jgi:hypothetical protein
VGDPGLAAHMVGMTTTRESTVHQSTTPPDTVTGGSPLTQRRTEVADAVAFYLVSGQVPVHPSGRWLTTERLYLASAVCTHAERPDTPLQPADAARLLVAFMRSEISDPVCDWLADGIADPTVLVRALAELAPDNLSFEPLFLLAWCELRDGNPTAADEALARLRAVDSSYLRTRGERNSRWIAGLPADA